MSFKTKLSFITPFAMLFLLIALLAYQLFNNQAKELPSALIGEDLPHFAVHELFHPNQLLTDKNFQGQISLLNVWATWCDACTGEHDMLMKIKNEYHIPIYGLDYKDEEKIAAQWLKQHGNPYIEVGQDFNGNLAIDLGVYGTPETFVISSSGKIIYRHVGAIDQNAWEYVLFPLIKKLEASKA